MHQRGLVFLWFPIHPVFHRHTLSPFLSPSLFPFYVPFMSQWEVKWVCSVHRCGPVWRVAVFLHRWFIMHEHGRSVDLRQNVPRCYLTFISPDTVQDWLYHKPEHVPEQKPYPASLMMSAPTAVTPILLQWQAKQDDYLKITHKWVFWKLAFQIHHSTISECKNMIKTRSLSALDLTIKL